MLFSVVAVLGFMSCAQGKKKEGCSNGGSCCGGEKTETVATVALDESARAVALEDIARDGEKLVGKQVKVRGVVDHVCSHAGKKCFISKEGSDASLQILAGGEVKAFSKELMGKEIEATGVMKEHRITNKQVEAQKASLKKKMETNADEKTAHACSRGMVNVEKMEAWMKTNSKDYYPIYFMEGLKYVEVQ